MLDVIVGVTVIAVGIVLMVGLVFTLLVIFSE